MPSQTLILWIVGGLLLAGMVAAMIMYRSKSAPGFKEVVKNPEHWDELEDLEKVAQKAIRESKNWDEDKIADVVRHFIFEVPLKRDAGLEARVLGELEPKTYPTVVAILSDKSLSRRLVTPTGTDFFPETPFERACSLFGESAPGDAVDAVAPFLDHSEVRLRKVAALVIGKAGTENIVLYIRKALADAEEYTGKYALMGLQFALKDRRLPPTVAEELFPDVLKAVEEARHSEYPPQVLFKLDPVRAQDFFLSPQFFSAQSKAIHHALEVMAGAKVSVPRAELLRLIAELESKEMKYPNDYALSHALQLLGGQGNAGDAAFLRIRMRHANGKVAQGAAAGVLVLAGLDGFQERVWQGEGQRGYAALPNAQRYFIAVRGLDGEVNNGGFAQYFVNSSGDQWRDALAGLEAIGSKERYGMAKEAVSLFGPAGPAEDRDERQDQLSKIYKKNDAVFEEIESRYYKSGENLEVLMTDYVIEHADQFR